MTKLVSLSLSMLADIFYPKYCFGCRRSGYYLCKFCITQIPAMAQTFCCVCNQPSANGFTHVPCRSKNVPDRLLSALTYKNPVVADMIIAGKYYFIAEVFNVLGALTAQTLMQQYEDITEQNLSGFVVCAIPLHKQRQKWRGFNQSEIVAKTIAQAFNLPFAPILTRIKKTQTQKDLTQSARKQNMQNAFRCQYRSPRKVLLIDDVSTTGQTFLAATQALKQNGAETVWCLSIAKD